METKIILVVGASGVGKDTLLRHCKEHMVGLHFIKRYISRQADGNEDNIYLDKESFKEKIEEGFFISTWQAHGNFYGIAKNSLHEGVNVISISREHIKDFEKVFKNVVTIHVSIEKEQLRKRLLARGREDIKAVEKRLARANKRIDAKKLITFRNDKALEVSTIEFEKVLKAL